MTLIEKIGFSLSLDCKGYILTSLNLLTSLSVCVTQNMIQIMGKENVRNCRVGNPVFL